MNHTKSALFVAFFFLFSIVIFGQNPAVDAGFAPAVSRIGGGVQLAQAVQPDGKVVAAGNFQVVNGAIRYNVVRLNADGTNDATFNCAVCSSAVQIVTSVVVQPDGKILVAGRQSIYLPYGRIIRLNADGSLDGGFNFSTSDTLYGVVTVKGVFSDGKILVVSRVTAQSSTTERLRRLNADGSYDNSFSSLSANVDNNSYFDAKILPDGRVFVFGINPYGSLALLNFDGSKNNSFQSPAIVDQSSTGVITDLALQADGKIAVIGRFSAINGISRKNLARLNVDQSVDTTFNPALTFSTVFLGGQIIALSNNKLLVGSGSIASAGKIQRLNSDGSADGTFFPPSDFLTVVSMQIDALERIYVFGQIAPAISALNKLLRFGANGVLDSSFNPIIELSGSISALGLQPDGKILLGGAHEKVNGFSRKIVSRINQDGTTDTSFDTADRFASGTINDFAVQPDGKILVAGNFFYNGSTRSIVRLNADGSLDTMFNATPASAALVLDVAVQTDGKILIGGEFNFVNGTARNGIARLNGDGSLDSSFNIQLGTARVSVIILQPDGKIMIGGSFSGVNGFNRSNIARFNSDGTLDLSFNASVNPLEKLLIRPDGKYLALNSRQIYLLNSDGSADANFTSPTLPSATGTVFTDLALLNDNSIVVSGNFYVLNNTTFSNIARLQQNGTPDAASFRVGSDGARSVLLKQPDGKVLMGGGFKLIEDVGRTGLARLIFAQNARKTPFDFDGDGRTDISVYRPSSSVWYQLLGSNYQLRTTSFGIADDLVAPADYDGDGKTDLGIFRPSTGTWWFAATGSNGQFRATQWGQAGDVPLPSDIDGNGKDDFVLFRPSNSTWYRLSDSGVSSSLAFGLSGDKPLIGDFDGDGKADYAIFRPSTGVFWYAASSQNNAFRAVQFGSNGDIPVAADYDGDGKTDFAVFRPSNGGWYILNSGNNSVTSLGFGLNGDKPVAGDYDGDGKADIAVYRPSNGSWYLLRSTSGFAGLQFGVNSDVPIPNAFLQ